MPSHRPEADQSSPACPDLPVRSSLWIASLVLLSTFACLDRKEKALDASTGVPDANTAEPGPADSPFFLDSRSSDTGVLRLDGNVALDVAGQGGMVGMGGAGGQGGAFDVPQNTGAGGTVVAGHDGSVDLPQGTGSGGVVVIGEGGTGTGGAVGQGGSTSADARVDQTAALPVGAACRSSGECTLGNCIDGFCCASACAGCSACSNALTGKVNGTCAPALSGQDPHDTCADETTSNQCGNDGTCDGAGACRKVGTNHTCTPAACSSDGKTFTPATTCDGKGACTTAAPQSCGAFQCASTGCLKTCTNQTDCGTGNYCNTAAGTCAAKQQNGQPATNAYECTSGILSGGVCCNTSCSECNSCSTGTCTPVSNGTSCGSGQVCAGGGCQAGCWIGGSLFTSNTVNSSNNCQVCAPAKSTTAWSNNEAYPPSCNINDRRYCSNGILTTTTCPGGCLNGECRQDGTIGAAGRVTCGTDGKDCPASLGCFWLYRSDPNPGICGDPNDGIGRLKIYCDGPNDCAAGQVCCSDFNSGANASGLYCFDGSSCPPNADFKYYNMVCDPEVPRCPYPQYCEKWGSYSWYQCRDAP